MYFRIQVLLLLICALHANLALQFLHYGSSYFLLLCPHLLSNLWSVNNGIVYFISLDLFSAWASLCCLICMFHVWFTGNFHLFLRICLLLQTFIIVYGYIQVRVCGYVPSKLF